MDMFSTSGLPCAAALRRRLGLGFCPTSGPQRWGLFTRPEFDTRWRWPFILLAAGALIFFFSGCQKITTAERYPTQQELRLQQTRDWQDLADVMAERIAQEINASETYRGLPVFVKTPEASVFILTFGKMLRAQLSRRGFRLSDTPLDAIILEYQNIERRAVSVKLVYDQKTVLTETKTFDPGPTELTREMADAVWERYAKRRQAYLR